MRIVHVPGGRGKAGPRGDRGPIGYKGDRGPDGLGGKVQVEDLRRLYRLVIAAIGALVVAGSVFAIALGERQRDDAAAGCERAKIARAAEYRAYAASSATNAFAAKDESISPALAARRSRESLEQALTADVMYQLSLTNCEEAYPHAFGVDWPS